MATGTHNILARQGHRLLQLGIALLLVASVEGFFIPRLAAPRLGLSAHTLASLQSVLFLVLGLATRIQPRPVGAARRAIVAIIGMISALVKSDVGGAAYSPRDLRCRGARATKCRDSHDRWKSRHPDSSCARARVRAGRPSAHHRRPGHAGPWILGNQSRGHRRIVVVGAADRAATRRHQLRRR
jgi:hypothetical protein